MFLKILINSHTTIMQQLKSLLLIPTLFVCICSANAQTPAYKSVPISTDSLRKAKPDLEKPDKKGISHDVQKMPEFPGGAIALLNYISSNIRYPVEANQKGIQGTVLVQCLIDKIGKVGKAKVLTGISPELDAEAVRVVESMPDWIPGERNREKVSVYYTFPVKFKLK